MLVFLCLLPLWNYLVGSILTRLPGLALENEPVYQTWGLFGGFKLMFAYSMTFYGDVRLFSSAVEASRANDFIVC
jgi:hypothetical protein